MVLLAPSAAALQKLLDVCACYANEYDIVYQTKKSVCMTIWPKRMKYPFSPKFYLHGDELECVKEFRYLGQVITDELSDDVDMKEKVRSLYAVGNMLIRRFGRCDETVRLSLFKTYCYNVYGCALWCNYCVASWRKLKVAHNDILRKLLKVPRYHSASTLFVTKHVDNLDVLLRKNMYSLWERFSNSNNSIVARVYSSEVRAHSKIWSHFMLKLYKSDFMYVV